MVPSQDSNPRSVNCKSDALPLKRILLLLVITGKCEPILIILSKLHVVEALIPQWKLGFLVHDIGLTRSVGR